MTLSAACGAELVFGAHDKPREFLYFYIGYFVGGGLVLDNKLYTGKSGDAGALGSMPVAGSGTSGQQLVDVASLSTLEAMLHDGWREATAMAETIRRRGGSHETFGIVWLDAAAKALAQAIRAATCLIDFDTVMIDGSLPEETRADLVVRTRRALDVQPLPGVNTPEVREGTIGADARALGAASLPLSGPFPRRPRRIFERLKDDPLLRRSSDRYDPDTNQCWS